MSDLLDAIYHCVLAGDNKTIVQHVNEALNNNIAPVDILNQAMIRAMDRVGSLFEAGEIFVPEMLISARAMKTATSILKPYLSDSGIEPIGKVVIATVKGDLHDIGKNLVGFMLEGAGFEVIDLGVDIPPEDIVQAVNKNNAYFVGLSALLTTTMNSMTETIDALKRAGYRDKITVMVGGAPVTQQFADDIGADIYAPDAASAARKAKTFALDN